MPVQIWWQPHSELHMKNGGGRRIWHSIVTGGHNTHLRRWLLYFKNVGLDSHFRLRLGLMTMRWQKLSLPRLRKKKHTAESTPQKMVFTKVSSDLSSFTMKCVLTERWNTRHRKGLKMRTLQQRDKIIWETTVHITAPGKIMVIEFWKNGVTWFKLMKRRNPLIATVWR